MDGAISPERLRAVIDTQNQIASAHLNLDTIMRIVAEEARELTRADAAVLEIPEGEEMVYRAAVGTAAEYLDVRLRIDSSLSGHCLRENRVLRSADATDDPRTDREMALRVGARSMICVPLRHAGEVAGVLKVYSAESDVYSDEDVETLNLLSGVIAAHMTNASRYALATQEGRTDALTGLANRRAYDTALAAELSYCRRREVVTSLCLIDLDGFKQLNDTLGHAAGDEVLRGVGSILAEGRIEDRTFRIGGDEFAVIFRDTDRAGGEIAAARIADQIDSELAGLGVTASYGVAESDGDPAFTVEADQRLYAMKAIRTATGGRSVVDD
jgi:diguanylate cyclase (GGDEF)-like protein